MVQRVNNTADLNTHSLQVEARATELLGQTQDLRIGERGYVLPGIEASGPSRDQKRVAEILQQCDAPIRRSSSPPAMPETRSITMGGLILERGTSPLRLVRSLVGPERPDDPARREIDREHEGEPEPQQPTVGMEQSRQ
jgi:hypothetical protein